MEFIVGGGRPNHVKEQHMIKDDDGYVMTTKSYIDENPELFEYIGHVRINSTIIHTHRFLG